MPSSPLNQTQRQTLRQVARDAIAHELYQYVAMDVDPSQYSPPLCNDCATFVTLQTSGKLRGCIGTLEAQCSLVADVARNAAAAAFSDPRFPRLTRSEFESLEIHISILSPSVPIEFESESDLLGKIRPAEDGLTLIEQDHRGTFLPSVWEQIDNPKQFLQHLKLKAGLPADYWSKTIQVSRYTTESF